MREDDVTLRREQVGEIFRALDGIGNLVNNLVSTPVNAADTYAIISNIAVIQATLSGLPRVHSN